MKYLPFFFLLLSIGCSQGDGLLSENTAAEQNPLVKTREVRDIKTTIELIDPIALAAQDSKREPEASLEELITQREKSITIKLNLATAEAEDGDVMRYGTYNAEQFKAQAFDMNFAWESLIELRCGDATYLPVLSTLENTYGLTRDRNVLLVFAPSETDDKDFYSSEEIKVVFRDDLFGTGIQHFTFKREDLNQASKNRRG